MIGFLCFQDENDLRLALNGRKYWAVLWDLDRWCRNVIKYEQVIGNGSAEDALQMVRDLISEQIDMDEIE